MAKTNSARRLDQSYFTRDGCRVPPYTPTEEEIAAGCLQIRADWDEAQCRKRAGVQPQYPADVQVIHVGPKTRAAIGLGGV